MAIPIGILERLVPQREPGEGFPERDRPGIAFLEGPQRYVALWSAYVRYKLANEFRQSSALRVAVGRAGFIGTGIFRFDEPMRGWGRKDFPWFEGYQFGVCLHVGYRVLPRGQQPLMALPLEGGELAVPIVEMISSQTPQSATSDGYVSALYEDDSGEIHGITAGHVIESYSASSSVPVECSDCGSKTQKIRNAPGLIDAATVEYVCGKSLVGKSATVRRPNEGEDVDAWLGETGKSVGTVMQILQTSSELISSAVSMHFLIDVCGVGGDSGSLVACKDGDETLLGMYLGLTDSEDDTGTLHTYGYALELQQVAHILGVTIKEGERND